MPADGAAGAGAGASDSLAKRQARVSLGAVDQRTAKQLLRDHDDAVRMEVAKAIRRRRLDRVTWIDREDLMQIGRSAVLEAFVKYDPTRGAKFTTWATTVVRWRVAEAAEMALGTSDALEVCYVTRKKASRGEATKAAVDQALDRYRALRSVQVVSLSALTFSSQFGDSGMTIAEIIPDTAPSPEEDTAERESRARIYRLIELLDDRRHQMIILAELQGQSGAALAREIGVTRQLVNYQRKRALEAIQEVARKQDPQAALRAQAREKLTREIADRASARLRRRQRRRARTALTLAQIPG